HRGRRQDEIPQFAGVAGAASILADEDAQKILQPHLLEPLDRFDDDMMTLASQNTTRDQDHLGLAADAPCCSHRLHAFACNVFRTEALELNAAGHNRDFLPRSAIAIIDQLRDLLTRRDDMVTPRHDAVIAALEEILFAESLVPAGYKRNTAEA